MSDRIAQLTTHLHMRARIHETLRDGEAIDYAQVRAWAPTLRETAEALTALEAERDVLRTALRDVLPYICEGVIECGGNKCRLANCASCCINAEDAGEKSVEAANRARAALAPKVQP